MSGIDGTEPNEIQQPEQVELPPNPETAESRDDFKECLDANKEHITDGMRSDDDWNDRASEIADNYSPDEIREKMEALGDQNELAQQYEDAVFGNYENDADKEKAIAESGEAWASAVEKNEVYSMALEKFDTGDEGAGGEVAESPEGGEAVEPPRISDGTDDSAQNEPVDHYHGFERGGREMTPEEKEAYGITQEIEDFVATGKDFEVLLPSQMEARDNGEAGETTEEQPEVNDDIAESSDAMEAQQEPVESGEEETKQDGFWDFFRADDSPEAEPEPENNDEPEKDAEMEVVGEGSAEFQDAWEADRNVELKPDADTSDEVKEVPPEDRIEGYKEEIGHNDLADIEAYRAIKVGDRIVESMRDNYLAGGVDDAYKNVHETRTDIGAINEMADKMREYTISQGHKADYTEER